MSARREGLHIVWRGMHVRLSPACGVAVDVGPQLDELARVLSACDLMATWTYRVETYDAKGVRLGYNEVKSLEQAVRLREAAKPYCADVRVVPSRAPRMEIEETGQPTATPAGRPQQRRVSAAME